MNYYSNMQGRQRFDFKFLSIKGYYEQNHQIKPISANNLFKFDKRILILN